MNYARQVGNVIQEIIPNAPDFHPDVNALFFQVADTVQVGATLVNDAWVNPDPVVPPPPSVFAPDIIVSPVEFKMLFTSQERIAIAAARASDPIIDDWYSILDDSRLTEVNLGRNSTQAGVMYLNSLGLITNQRAAEILSGALL